MIDLLDTIKKAYDISTTQIDKIVVDGQEYRINNVEYYDDCYDEGNIFGTAIARGLDFEIENTVDLEKKEIEYFTGIKVNGETQWIGLGKFIIQSVEPNDTTGINKVTSMDFMLKTNIPYSSNLNYSDGTVTLLDVLQEVCTNSGIKLATMNFPNSSFVVTSNQFEQGTLNRQVIQAVAQISGTVAKIKSDNSLYLVNPNQVTSVSKVFKLNNYKEAEIKRNTHPINIVSLGMADVEGENITLRDEESIAGDGENILAINDNPFAYTQAKREQLITALFNAVKGFEYKSYSFKCQGLPYLETLNKVQFQDKEGNTYDSYVFRFNYKSPKGLESTIEAPSIIKATVNYQNIPDALEISKRTEIIVDKQNQTIQEVISNVTEQNNKIAQVTQTVDELNSKIGDIADITTSKESLIGTVSFEKVNQSEPIYVKIYPRITDIAYLYPRNNLYPSDNLYPQGRTLRFENTQTNEYFDYELPTDLLYYDAENYDEFILDYDAQSCVINKRVGYNADGTTYPLETPQTISYEYPRILLTDGDYTITMLGYPNAYLFVRLMAQNIYITQFATKAEVNSEISQTTQSINLSVDKKLTNYSTTTQMNSAISMTANEINSEVSKKVGEDEIISKINQTAEAITIDANRININGAVSANGNFKVDKNGNMECNNGKFNGGNLELIRSGGMDYFTFYEDESKNNDYKTYIDSQSIGINSGDVRIEMAVPPVSLDGIAQIDLTDSNSYTSLRSSGIITPSVTQTSLESIKKNFEEVEDATSIIKNSEIYKYNFKSEEDTDKKHYGFVIGEDYNTPEEVISKSGEGIDTYSMCSILWKAVQEQQETIEALQKEINNLKGEN